MAEIFVSVEAVSNAALYQLNRKRGERLFTWMRRAMRWENAIAEKHVRIVI